MKKYNFSFRDRDTIAEFIYGYTNDVLIKSDAVNLVKVLFRHEILFNMNSWLKSIEKQDPKVSTRLIDLLEENVSREGIVEIMKEYYGINSPRT